MFRRKRERVYILVLIAALFLNACSSAQDEVEDVLNSITCAGATKIENQFLVQWADGKITTVNSKSKEDFIDNTLLKNRGKIIRAEQNYKLRIPQIQKGSDDDLTLSISPINWGVDKIQASHVWPRASGKDIIVAVIDSGVDISHFQLANQLHQNAAEVGGVDGVDDDGNGLIDDKNGWDFVADSGVITDVLVGTSHGTHVAGIIAAQHSGDGFVKGVAPAAKILPINFMDADSGGSISDAVEAIDYAVAQGAKVLNASWGGSGCSSILDSKVASLADAGVLFVAAAGNSGLNISEFPEFPAAYQFGHQITVGASTDNNFRVSFSNFSNQLVHLLAPGFEIISTVAFDDPFSSKNGTSMAAPFVSGAAAVLWSSKPEATPSEIKSALLNSVAATGSSGDTITGGQLDLRAAYNLLHGTSF